MTKTPHGKTKMAHSHIQNGPPLSRKPSMTNTAHGPKRETPGPLMCTYVIHHQRTMSNNAVKQSIRKYCQREDRTKVSGEAAFLQQLDTWTPQWRKQQAVSTFNVTLDWLGACTAEVSRMTAQPRYALYATGCQPAQSLSRRTSIIHLYQCCHDHQQMMSTERHQWRRHVTL